MEQKGKTQEGEEGEQQNDNNKTVHRSAASTDVWRVCVLRLQVIGKRICLWHALKMENKCI